MNGDLYSEDPLLIEAHIQCLEKMIKLSNENDALISLIGTTHNKIDRMNVLKEIEVPLFKFRDNFSSINEKTPQNILDNLSQILGHGSGSTPESDDIFLGVITSIHVLSSQFQEQFNILSKFPFTRITTSKSARLIRLFINRNYPSILMQFIELLMCPIENSNKFSLFEQEIRKIQAIGASSGYNFLIGVLWGLKYNIQL
ncbi:MAG: oxamate carbamoyltransferase subunit AllH family protein [Candidatus Hodarchaeales archaeon]|jgi:hypothetical protein